MDTYEHLCIYTHMYVYAHLRACVNIYIYICVCEQVVGCGNVGVRGCGVSGLLLGFP